MKGIRYFHTAQDVGQDLLHTKLLKDIRKLKIIQ